MKTQYLEKLQDLGDELPDGLEAQISALEEALEGNSESESSDEGSGAEHTVTDSESDTEEYRKLVDAKARRRRVTDLMKKNEVGETKLHSVRTCPVAPTG